MHIVDDSMYPLRVKSLLSVAGNMSESPIYPILLKLLEEHRISDFHMRAGEALAVRLGGDIMTFPEYMIDHAMLDQIFRHQLGEPEYAQFCQTNDVDFAMMVGQQRFRVNGYRTMNGWAMVLRTIVTEVPNIDNLGLPAAVHNILTKKSGLVLVTGQTGSGKSTSLAAMVNKINRERTENIITIEDPVEFIHHPIKSIVSQREVGRDTDSFAAALKGLCGRTRILSCSANCAIIKPSQWR